MAKIITDDGQQIDIDTRCLMRIMQLASHMIQQRMTAGLSISHERDTSTLRVARVVAKHCEMSRPISEGAVN